MATENISIEITDNVATSISTKIQKIATDSRDAYAAVTQLKAQLASINSSAVTAMSNAVNNSQLMMQRAALAAQKLATAQQQTTTAAQKLATEQQRTALQAANAAAATDRAALAALRLQTAQDKAAASTDKASTSVMGYVKSALALVGVGLTADAIIKTADAYTVLQNKLQNVSTSQDQVNELTARLYDLANRTRASVDETATAFTRFDRALKFMGKSQEDTLRMTETINKGLVVSGATATEAASALLQLSQAFNSGKLQGDEFRAISENMPMVLDAVAKALNVPINQVKKYGTEGKITSEVLYKAFTLMADTVDKTFAKTIPTVSQSMVVLQNSASQFFGELNKATGTTQALSSFILLLAQNMKALALTVVIVGVALLAAFGPSLVGMITSATAALKTFTLALIANPIGAFAALVIAAVAAVTLFKDEISATSKENADLVNQLVELSNILINGINTVLSKTSELFSDVTKKQDETSTGANILSIALKAAVEVFKVIMVVGANVAFVFNAIGTEIGGIAAQIAALARGDITGFHAISDAMKADAAKARLEIDKFSSDVMKMGTSPSNAGGLAALTAGLDPAKTSSLRGAGKNQLTNTDDGKAAESRAKAMAKVNGELNNEIARMGMLKPLRDDQAKFDTINLALQQKKITLTTAEADSIKSRITAIREGLVIQAQADRIYQESIGPLETYNASMTAASQLLAKGAISQDDFNKEVTKSTEAYKNAIDPMRQYNKDLQQQFDLIVMLPKQREIEQQIMQVTNDQLAKGHALTVAETQALREKLTVLQQLNGVSSQEASLLSASVDKRQQQLDQMKAITNLSANPQSGFNKGDQATAVSKMVGDLGLDTTGLQVQAQAQVEVYKNMYAQIDELRKNDLINDTDASQLRMQVWQQEQANKLQTGKTFFTGLEALSSSSNKSLAAVGKAAAITNAIVNTYTAATGAYAAMSSIPYVGPALGAAAAAAAIAAGMANVAAIRSQSSGYQSGGYTGSMGVSEVAGVVHGQEYVMDAATTQRVGIDNLNALRTGAAQVQQASVPSVGTGTSGTAPAPGSTPQADSNGIRVINVIDPSMVSDYMNSPSGEKTMINFISRNSNKVKQLIG